MKNFFLTLHMLSMCLVVGTLFLQSLSVVLGLRLKSTEERAGLKKTQKRIHKFIYYGKGLFNKLKVITFSTEIQPFFVFPIS